VVDISTAYSITALIFSFLAVISSFLAITVSVRSARQQSADVRRSNLMIFINEKVALHRSPEYQEASNYIRAELPKIDPARGVYDLPTPAREHVLLVGGFYHDLGTLALTGVLEQDLVVALFYANIKEMWRILDPYIRRERDVWKSKNAGDFWPSFEHLAVYVDTVSHEKVCEKYWGRRLRFPATPQEATPPGDPSVANR
jgi:hypothetical protein